MFQDMLELGKANTEFIIKHWEFYAIFLLIGVGLTLLNNWRK